MISQVAILSLTLIKYRTARLRGWDPVPIVALVVRDGIVIFAILISKTCALKIYCNTNRTNCILVVATLTVVATSTHNDYVVHTMTMLQSATRTPRFFLITRLVII